MKTLKLDGEKLDADSLKAIVAVLNDGGLVSCPCQGSYRLLADLNNEKAVQLLFQSKRRVQKAPSLVFIGQSMLHTVADSVDSLAIQLARAFWPGQLTILFDPHPELSSKVTKQLTKYNKKIGVRMPVDPILSQIIAAFGAPLLISSANKENKQGAGSPAQIRKNFVGRVDIFVDAGDLTFQSASTVVDTCDGQLKIIRSGAISDSALQAILRA